MNKSTSFLLPLMKFSRLVLDSYTTTYIGHADYEGIDTWGNYFYLQIVPELLDAILLEELRYHPQYVTEIDEKDFVFFVFAFTPEQTVNVVNPFIKGQYSKISREYVDQHFPKYIKGKISMNWRILNKDEWAIPSDVVPLRNYWLARIGKAIPVDGEVWSKPKMEEEIYDYYNGVLKENLKKLKPVIVDISFRLLWRTISPPGMNYPEEQFNNALLLLIKHKRRLILQRKLSQRRNKSSP